MTHLAEDVAAAVELVERIRLDDWPRLMDGPSHSQPRISDGDLDALHDLQVWLAQQRADEPTSAVSMAITNFRRVLDDLLFVFEYDLEPAGHYYRVRKWYHRGNAGSGSPLDVEHYSIHVLLIRDLVAELTRSINLVVARARASDDRAFVGCGLATLDTGSPDAQYQAAQYSADEGADDQPYPGLLRFPLIIEQRDFGVLGTNTDGSETPRTPQDFTAWVEKLIEEKGTQPSGPPPANRPRLARTAASRGGAEFPLNRFSVGYVVLTLVSVIAGVASKPWIIGAAIGAVLPSLFVHRQLSRDPPKLWAVLLVLVGGVVGVVVSLVLTRASPRPDISPSTVAARSPTQRAVRSVGQFQLGDILRVGIGDARPVDYLRAGDEQRVTFRFRISNGGPDTIREATITASLPAFADVSLSVEVKAVSASAYPSSAADTATVAIRRYGACLRYEPGSGAVLNASGGVVDRPSAPVTEGVVIRNIGVPNSDVRFVRFRARVARAPIGERCATS